ncbi:MAG: PHP domain-containing protein [Dehalococcoidales bacterium]
MASTVDLHTHTSASDGRFSPEDVVRKSAARGLGVIAICDHDTTSGIAPALKAARAWPQLRVIPGVEVSTQTSGSETHVLGYFIDLAHPQLKATLARLRHSRRGRARAMIAKLKALGIHVSWQRVQEIAGGGSIGRPHIAQTMLENGYITSFKEAFTRYLGLGGPAYVERHKITPVEAVALIIKANGLPVLAHPTTVKDPEAMIAELKAAGLVGIEVYYNGYSDDERDSLARLADRYNLIATGGSDYHGLDDNTETMLGDANVPQEAAEQLIARAQQRLLKLAGS